MRLRVLIVLALALVAVGIVLPAPPAQARDCGKSVINQYFNTGRISYHAQECYASALKQIDPDARMYSGIIGAIRAARARDRAADERAARAAEEPDPAEAPAEPIAVDPAAPEPIPLPLPEPEPTPVPDEALDDPVVAEVAAVDLAQEQAAPPVPVLGARVPLPVVLLGLLAGVLTLVGVGGLAVRWIDRTG